jgi:hypothetical protein
MYKVARKEFFVAHGYKDKAGVKLLPEGVWSACLGNGLGASSWTRCKQKNGSWRLETDKIDPQNGEKMHGNSLWARNWRGDETMLVNLHNRQIPNQSAFIATGEVSLCQSLNLHFSLGQLSLAPHQAPH